MSLERQDKMQKDHLTRLFSLFLGIFTIFSFSLVQADDFYFNPPADAWGLVPAHVAVVNPATRSKEEKVLSLRGTWDFCLDETVLGRHRMGKGPDWNEPDWSDTRSIEVPGCWENQGVGEPGDSHTWDPIFDNCVRPLKNTYWGPARYRKSVTIPSDWPDAQNGRIWLAVGGVRTEAYLWVNQKRVAHVNNYCGTYKFDITDYVTPGEEAEIVATVRNDSPSRKGQMTSFNKFGGFYRDLELQATGGRWIDDLWVRGDLDKKSAEVHLKITAIDEHFAQKYPEARVTILTLDGEEIVSQNIPLDSALDSQKTVTLAMDNLIAWSPENPQLYVAEVRLLDKTGHVGAAASQRFGIKKFEVRGDRFYLNNQPYYLRGYGDDWIYPLTLISPADKAEHLKNFRVIKEAGFNAVRLHTHCELPEYFEAADESGVLVQPELPYYHDITTEAFEFDPMRDLQELCANYRRFVSFAVYSLGNEGHLGSPLDTELYRWAKTNDPDRLIEHQDGGCNITEGERKNADFDTPNGYNGATSILPWPVGTFDYLTVPFVAHEYLNLAVKMDPRSEPLFTGGLPAPLKIADYEARLNEVGLDRSWGDRCLKGAAAVQSYYQKQGVEAARIDPHCDGFSYWTLLDVMVPVRGTYSGQGLFDAFYRPKEGGFTPKQFAQFNAPTVLLATFPQEREIFSSGETITADLAISHFGTEPVPAGKVEWSLVASEDSAENSGHTNDSASGNSQPLAAGTVDFAAIPTGFVGSLGSVKITVPALKKPCRAEWITRINGSAIQNRWNVWLFPETASSSETIQVAATAELLEAVKRVFPNAVDFETAKNLPAEAVVVLNPDTDTAALEKALAQKRRILAVGTAEGDPNVALGWWWLGEQLGTGFDARHEAFGDFPLSETLDGLWFRIFKLGRDLKTPSRFATLSPLAVGETVDSYRVSAAAGRIDGANVLATFGLDLTADLPEAKSLLANFVRYLAK